MNSESTQTFTLPLKKCQGATIHHDLVTVALGVEWPPNGGDDPHLLIHISNNLPSMNYTHQPLQPFLVNSVHHHQHQDSSNATYQQQPYCHTPGINNYDPINSMRANPVGVHTDVLSQTTTTTIVYNPPQTQSQPPASVDFERIVLDLKSVLGPQQCSTRLNQAHLTPQRVNETLPSELNDFRFDTTMSNIGSAAMPSITVPHFNLPPPPTPPCPTPTSNNTYSRFLVCACPHPTTSHNANCALYSQILPEPMHQALIYPPDIQRIAPTLPAHVTSVVHIPTMTQPMITTTLTPLSNPNVKKSMDPSSSITTIVSQPSSFLTNPSIGQTIKLPPMTPNGSFQPQKFDFSQVVVNTPSYCPTHQSMSMIQEQTTVSTKPRQRKTAPTKRTRQTKKTPNKTEPNSNPPSLLPSPIVSQKGMSTIPDNSQITDSTLSGSTNDSKVIIAQQSSPLTNTSIRSPVELCVDVPISFNHKTIPPEEAVDEVIKSVLNGEGTILTRPSLTILQPPKRSSVTSQLVVESAVPVATKTYLSPLSQEPPPSVSTLNDQSIIHVTECGIFPSIAEQNRGDVSPTMNNTKKRVRSEPTSNTTKIKCKAKSQFSPSSVTSTSNIGGKLSPWSDTPMSSSSSNSATFSTLELSNHPVTNSSFDKSDVFVSNPTSSTEAVQIIPTDDQYHGVELSAIFSPKFDSSSINPACTEYSLDTSNLLENNTTDLFEDFLSLHSTTWGENQVTSTVMIPSDPPNNSVHDQQSYSQNDLYFDANLQSQTHTSQYPETNLNNIHSMNNNDDVQQPSKQSTKSSKLPRKQNRPNPIKKSSSSKPTCTRCGFKRLIDITQHEFPKQKGLVFECASCGNNSIRSNVSADERKRRLAKVAADHLNKIECHFCQRIFHSHDDYIIHLRIDHESTKPL